jgi:hypothetical protein
MDEKRSYRGSVRNKVNELYEDKLARAKSAAWEFIRLLDNNTIDPKMTKEESERINAALGMVIEDIDRGTFRMEYLTAHWERIKSGKFKMK